jgi:TolB-like protein/Tfp pilus assembly protein PilF
MASFLTELVRRNVLRSAVLYLASAWLILQVADLVLAAFDVPQVALRVLIIVFAVGFPVFLLLSWFYELKGARLVRDTGEPVEKRSRWSSQGTNVAIAILVVAAVGIYFVTRAPVTDEPESAAAAAQPTADGGLAIAVLPLANISDNPADEYLADGLTEELLNVLASIPQLKMTARASSFVFKNAATDVRTIGEQLAVDYVIEGSVRKAGHQLRIAVQLVSTSTGRTLWSAVYDRELTDIFQVQKDIAERVSGTLQLSLFSDPTPIIRRTTADAYAAYLRAIHHYRSRSSAGYADAVAALEEALALDDQYAPAWTFLSSVRQNQALIGQIDYAEGHELARSCIERALEIDPNYAYAISSRAWLAMSYERDYETAARYFRRALELAPNDSDLLSVAAVLARLLGRPERAIELTSQSIAGNPMSAPAFINLSDQLYQGRRFAEAIDAAQRARQLAPQNPQAIVNLAAAQIFMEDPQGALNTVAEAGIPLYMLFVDALAHYDLGHKSEAEAALARLIDDHADQQAAYIAAVYAYRQEVDEAFRWLQRAIDERQRTLAVRTEPLYENLRDDARWQRVLEQLGLSDRQVADIEI